LIYLFDSYALDTDRRELRGESGLVPLQPQVFDLLEYLIRRQDRVVTRDDMLDAIWGGRIVSDSTLTSRINAARTAIGDRGEDQRLIRTLPRKGIRFVGTVREEGRPADETILTVPQSVRRLSIVVLPFANLSGDPEQDYFVDGITESLTTDLSRINGSFVIARNTAFTFKGKAMDVQKLGKELNVRYVLEGSVQRGGNQMRVNAQLIDVETGNHLWAERFALPIADLFDMQDEIVSSLAKH
jgi:TolB-like protein